MICRSGLVRGCRRVGGHRRIGRRLRIAGGWRIRRCGRRWLMGRWLMSRWLMSRWLVGRRKRVHLRCRRDRGRGDRGAALRAGSRHSRHLRRDREQGATGLAVEVDDTGRWIHVGRKASSLRPRGSLSSSARGEEMEKHALMVLKLKISTKAKQRNIEVATFWHLRREQEL